MVGGMFVVATVNYWGQGFIEVNIFKEVLEFLKIISCEIMTYFEYILSMYYNISFIL
jgi:hypothetical protein